MTQSAKGIKDRSHYGNLLSLRTDYPLTLVRQLHRANRAGDHIDLRIGNTGGMFSWAMPKDLPTEKGEKHLAVTQPLHDWSYNDFQGTIGKGYGAGTVTRLEKSPIIVLENTPNKLSFTRGDSKNAPVYTMLKTNNGNYITFIRGNDIPLKVKTYSKEHFKSVPLDSIADLMDENTIATPKLDGTGAIATLGDKGIRVFGIRPDKNGNPIEYTDYIGGLRNLSIPEDIRGLTLRSELVAQDQKGSNLPPQYLSGLLNSTLIKAASKKIEDGTQLRLAPLAIVKENGLDDYNRNKVDEIIQRLNLKQFFSIPTYNKEEALKAVEQMRTGKHPLTKEGIVIQRPGERPIKAKLTDDSDVVIRNIFPAVTKDNDNRAGGFEYSLPNGEQVVGRVGTGFNHELLKDMLNNPKNYIGRTARIKSLGQYDSGAYRAPSFISMKED